MSTEAPDRRALLREALRTVEEMQARLDASERAKREPIAVVGLGCRYPGAEDPDALWRLLRDGVDAIREVPHDRWDPDALDVGDAGEGGRTAARLGGYLERVDLFDPVFFGISPREAATLDPQQRLLLEVAWETLENAGQAPDRLVGSSTGVFVGITTGDYAKIVGVGEGAQTDVYAATGNALNAAAGRISFTLGLQGPCVSVDTACSSSLTAIHLASQALRAGECDLALAGGVNVILSPNAALLFARWGMLASDGRCKTFDSRADGFIRAEGCGMVALKRLSTALEHGDRVLALLLGSAVNQDGASSGLTVPNGPAQQAVLRRALAAAGVAPGEVDYVEAHGTGTPIGDPIEVEALSAVLGRDREPGRPLALGSIKTNIGHAEAASGVAGLLKVILSLQNETIPQHLHVRELNPRLAWGDAITVPTGAVPWQRGARRRVAGVSAFGFSGTNVHVVVAEAPEAVAVAAGPDGAAVQVLPLSAANEGALRAGAARLASRLAAPAEPLLADVAYTLGTGRARLGHRAAVVARSTGEARQRLEVLAAGGEAPGIRRGQVRPGGRPRIAFLFTGQGAQQAGMGRGLYDSEPIFRQAFDRCAEALGRHRERPLQDVVFGAPGTEEWLDQTTWTQPALFALEWAMAELLSSWGIAPDAVLGHSVGELPAACVAGVLSPEDGVRLAAERGRLMQAQPVGEMIAVSAPESRVTPLVEVWKSRLSVAAVNGPESVVLSGEREAMDELRARLDAEGLRWEALRVSHAFHSPMMEPALDALEAAAATVRHSDPHLDLVSNLTGEVAGPKVIGPAYWRRHAREAVRFEAALKTLQARGCDVLVEVGPHPTLLGLARQTIEAATFVPCLRRGQLERDTLADALATLFVHGAPVDWRSVHRTRPGRAVALPTYAFQRQRHWVERDARTLARPPMEVAGGARAHPLLGRRLTSPLHRDVVFEAHTSSGELRFLADHRLGGTSVYPATAYLEAALSAAATTAGRSYRLADVVLADAMILEGRERLTQVVLSPRDADAFEARIFSRRDDDSDDPWVEHAAARAEPSRETGREDAHALAEARARCPRGVDVASFYSRLEAAGLDYGKAFRGLTTAWAGEREAVGEVGLEPALVSHAAAYSVHPALLDSCFHLLGVADGGESSERADGIYVPVGVRLFEVHRPAGHKVWARAAIRQVSGAPDRAEGDLELFGDDGLLAARVTGLQLRRTSRRELLSLVNHKDRMLSVGWQLSPLRTPEAPALHLLDGNWLILADRGGVGLALAKRLESAGGHCIVASGADCPEPPEDHAATAALIDRATRQGPLGGVVYLRGLDVAAPSIGGVGVEPGQRAALGGLLHLVQSLATSGAKPAGLWVVTRGAQAVGNRAEIPGFAQASLWGFGRSLAIEHPELSWRGVDLDPAAATDESELLIAEIRAAGADSDQIAYRDGERWAPSLIRCALTRSRKLTLQPEATYLVTGGLGGLGLLVARWLAEHGARHVALVGRRPPSPGAEAAISEIFGLGARVRTFQCDVADEDELRRLLATLSAEMPALRGIVHAAGALADGVIAQQDWKRFDVVLRPKVNGAWNLHAQTATLSLDLFVAFSSAAAFGSAGQSNYAAANAFLDALMLHRRSSGLPGLAVNWGAWGGVGMLVDRELEERVRATGVELIRSADGIRALHEAVEAGVAQVAYLPLDVERASHATSSFPSLYHRMLRTRTPVERARQQKSGLSELMAAPAGDRPDVLLRILREHLSRVLQLPEGDLSHDRPLGTFGMDSLMAIELRNRVRQDLGVSLPLGKLAENPTLAELTEGLLARLPSQGGEPSTAGSTVSPTREAPVASVQGLSDAQVSSLLGELLAQREVGE